MKRRCMILAGNGARLAHSKINTGGLPVDDGMDAPFTASMRQTGGVENYRRGGVHAIAYAVSAPDSRQRVVICVCPLHQSRKAYYRRKALVLALIPEASHPRLPTAKYDNAPALVRWTPNQSRDPQVRCRQQKGLMPSFLLRNRIGHCRDGHASLGNPNASTPVIRCLRRRLSIVCPRSGRME